MTTHRYKRLEGLSHREMDLDQFERVLEEAAGGSSELNEESYEAGRTLAHLPD